jgi:LemA protein
MMEILIVFAILLVPVIIGYFWYVSIVSKRNKALEALSGIDVQLQKRSSLIPNLLKIARKFMEHEKTLLAEITALREKVQTDYDKKNGDAVKEHLAISEQLTQKMGQFMVQVEAYPDLKSDSTMLHAMQSYNEVESQIAASRRFYNSSVTALNNAVQIFPGNIIANMAGVDQMPFYEAEEAAKAPVDADAYLQSA